MNAIVLGASGDLGKHIVKLLESKGYHVTGTYHRTKEKNLYKLDMSNRKSIDKFVEFILAKEKIDFFTSTISEKLILNKFQSIGIDEFDSATNLSINHIYLLKKIIGHFNKDALILFILSEMVVNDRPNYSSSYMISKFTMLGIFKALSSELKNIRVNAISPGMMDTRFIKDMPKLAKDIYSSKYGLTDVNKFIFKISEIIDDKSMSCKNITIN